MEPWKARIGLRIARIFQKLSKSYDTRAACTLFAHVCAICSLGDPREQARAYVSSVVKSFERDDYKSMKSRRVIRKSARDYVLLCRPSTFLTPLRRSWRHASPIIIHTSDDQVETLAYVHSRS